jgi:hypothetical protein
VQGSQHTARCRRRCQLSTAAIDILSRIGVLAVCQGRKDAPRNGRRGSLIDVRTWNVIIIIINMRQGNVMHAMHTGLVSPVKTRLLRGERRSPSVHALVCSSCIIPGSLRRA